MLKHILTLSTAFVVLCNHPLCAQEANEPAAESAAQEEESISLDALLKEASYVTKVKPKKKASVYFILRSHSRCGFCRKITPEMNALYKDMKGKGAEIIMLNGDPDTEKASKWAEETDITIPMITPETAAVVGAKVPAGGSGGTPNIMAVMEDGTQIEGVSGASKCPELVSGWKDMVKEAKKAEKEKAREKSKAKGKKDSARKQKKSKKKKSKKDSPDEDI